jgi:polyhydroxyalkanoate synthesis regulator phasin
MKLKKLALSIAVASALIIPTSVFADTSDSPAAKTVRHFFGIDTSTLNEQQKADVAEYTKKMAELQKETINKMVSNGSMTKEQGEAAIKKIDDAVANGTFGTGMGKGGAFGKSGNRGGAGIDYSKLTDAQKADFSDTYKKIADLQKEYLKKQVSSGLITQIQADSASEKIDKYLTNDKFMMDFGKGGFGGGIALPGIDQSKLTDAQKADLEDYNNKLKELKKELINKAVANGVMTKEQGDSAIQTIDNGNTKGGSFKGRK